MRSIKRRSGKPEQNACMVAASTPSSLLTPTWAMRVWKAEMKNRKQMIGCVIRLGRLTTGKATVKADHDIHWRLYRNA